MLLFKVTNKKNYQLNKNLFLNGAKFMLITNTIVNLMAEKIHVRYLCLCISISLLDILKVRNVHTNRYQLFIVDRFY